MPWQCLAAYIVYLGVWSSVWSYYLVRGLDSLSRYLRVQLSGQYVKWSVPPSWLFILSAALSGSLVVWPSIPPGWLFILLARLSRHLSDTIDCKQLFPQPYIHKSIFKLLVLNSTIFFSFYLPSLNFHSYFTSDDCVFSFLAICNNRPYQFLRRDSIISNNVLTPLRNRYEFWCDDGAKSLSLNTNIALLLELR